MPTIGVGRLLPARESAVRCSTLTFGQHAVAPAPRILRATASVLTSCATRHRTSTASPPSPRGARTTFGMLPAIYKGEIGDFKVAGRIGYAEYTDKTAGPGSGHCIGTNGVVNGAGRTVRSTAGRRRSCTSRPAFTSTARMARSMMRIASQRRSPGLGPNPQVDRMTRVVHPARHREEVAPARHHHDLRHLSSSTTTAPAVRPITAAVVGACRFPPAPIIRAVLRSTPGAAASCRTSSRLRWIST